MRKGLILIVLAISSRLIFAAPNDASGEETTRWTPDSSVDGIPIVAVLKWRTTRYFGEPAFDAIVRCSIAESYVSVAGKRYAAGEIGADRFKTIKVQSDWSALVDVSSNGENLGSLVLSNGNANLYNVDGSDFGSAGLMGISTNLSHERLTQAQALAPLVFKNFRFTKLSFYISYEIRNSIAKASESAKTQTPAVTPPPSSTLSSPSGSTSSTNYDSSRATTSAGVSSDQENKARLDEERSLESIAAEQRQKEEQENAQAQALASAAAAAAPVIGNLIDSTDLQILSLGYSWSKTDYVSERGLLADSAMEVVDTHGLGFNFHYIWLSALQDTSHEFEDLFLGFGFEFNAAALLFEPGDLGMRALIGGVCVFQINDNLIELVVSAGINTGTQSLLESLVCIRYAYLFENWSFMGSGVYVSAGVGGDWEGEKRLQFGVGYIGFNRP